MAIDGPLRASQADSAMDRAASARWGGETKEGEAKDDDGAYPAEGGTPGWDRYEASRVRLDGLLGDLLRLQEERGGGGATLTIDAADPGFVAVVDRLSSLGMEERMRRRFSDQLACLREFAAMHGDCRVPPDHPTLGTWVRTQSAHYALCKRRMPSPLTCERFAALREVPGFDALFDEGGGTPPPPPGEETQEDAAADAPSGRRSVSATAPGGETEPKDDAAAAGAELVVAAPSSAHKTSAQPPDALRSRPPQCPSDASDMDSSVASARAGRRSSQRRWIPSDSSDLDSAVEDRRQRDDALLRATPDGRPGMRRAKGKRRRRKAGKAAAEDERGGGVVGPGDHGRSSGARSASDAAPGPPTTAEGAAPRAQRPRRRASNLVTIPSGRRLSDEAPKAVVTASPASPDPPARKPLDKEAVAAELRRKRAKGTSHKLAMRNSQRRNKDGSSSVEEEEVRPAAAAEPSSPDDASPDDAPPSPSRTRLPDKEAVAAEMRRKRARGTSHKLAMRNSRRLQDRFSDVSEDDNRPAARGPPPGGPPPVEAAADADAFEGALRGPAAVVAPRRRNRRDRYLCASAPVGSAAGGGRDDVASDADRYERRLERMMRKLAAEGGEDQSRGRTKDNQRLAASLPVASATVRVEDATAGGDVDPGVGRYEAMLDKLTCKLSAEGAAAGEPRGRTKDGGLVASSRPVASEDAAKTPPIDRRPRGDGARANAVESWDDLQDAIAKAMRQSVMNYRAPRDPGGDGGDGSSAASSDATSDDNGGNRGRSGPGTDSSGNCRRRGDRRVGRSVPANAFARGRVFDDRLGREPRAGEGPENVCQDRLSKSDPRDRRLGRSTPANAPTQGSALDDRLRGKLQRSPPGNRRLGQSVPPNASMGGSTYEDRLRCKLRGEAPGNRRLGQSMPANASMEGRTFDDRLRRKLQGEGPGNRRLGQSMPANASTEGSTFDDRLRCKLQGEAPGDRRLGQSMPANSSTGGSTFDERLRGKPQGEGPGDVRVDRQGGEGSSAVSSEAESDDESLDSLGSLGSLGSWDSLDGFRGKRNSRNKRSFGSSWMGRLNRPGWDSKDDSGVGGRESLSLSLSSAGRRASSRLSVSSVGRDWDASWGNLDEAVHSGRKYSRWKLLFDRNDYDHRKAQSGCVGDVLDAIICSERWHFVVKKNGDVALEMTTRTPAEHKTVELHVRKFEDMYSRSDFYFY